MSKRNKSVSRAIILKTILLSFIAAGVLHSGSAYAASDQVCHEYAATAAAQHRENQQLGCGFHGPRWNDNGPAAFIFCKAVGKSAARDETDIRETKLSGCRQAGNSNNQNNNNGINQNQDAGNNDQANGGNQDDQAVIQPRRCGMETVSVGFGPDGYVVSSLKFYSLPPAQRRVEWQRMIQRVPVIADNQICGKYRSKGQFCETDRHEINILAAWRDENGKQHQHDLSASTVDVDYGSTSKTWLLDNKISLLANVKARRCASR